jgi:SAM-dependent MidA family methyltransferase
VDLSGELRGRQREALKDFKQVVWLDELPESFSGVVIGNEVLDAMPVQLVVKTGQGWMERGVRLSGDAAQPFGFADQPAAPALIAEIPDAEELPIGYVTEVHLAANAFLETLARMLKVGDGNEVQRGAAILVDYGFPAAEYYLSQRSTGTLMCHYRHHAHDDPFYLPGLQDITAHVNFTAVARSAIHAGLDVLAYASQAAFLLQAGIGDLLMRTPVEIQAAYLPQANAMQKLVSPAEMGELFKVIVLGSGVHLPDVLSACDRSERL